MSRRPHGGFGPLREWWGGRCPACQAPLHGHARCEACGTELRGRYRYLRRSQVPIVLAATIFLLAAGAGAAAAFGAFGGSGGPGRPPAIADASGSTSTSAEAGVVSNSGSGSPGGQSPGSGQPPSGAATGSTTTGATMSTTTSDSAVTDTPEPGVSAVSSTTTSAAPTLPAETHAQTMTPTSPTHTSTTRTTPTRTSKTQTSTTQTTTTGTTTTANTTTTAAKTTTAPKTTTTRTPSSTTRTQTATTPTPLQLPAGGASTYAPGSDSQSDFGTPADAVDGSDRTAWTCTLNPDGTGAVDAGLLLDLGGPVRPTSLTIVTGTPWMSIVVEGTTGAVPSAITASGWVHLATVKSLKPNATVSLRHTSKPLRHLLVWIRQSPPGVNSGRLELNEVTVTS